MKAMTIIVEKAEEINSNHVVYVNIDNSTVTFF